MSVEARCVELPRETALRMVDEFSRPETATAAMEKLDAMIADGVATLRGILAATGEDDAPLLARSGSDDVYGTEFEADDRRVNRPKQPKGATLTYPTTTFERPFSGCSLALSCLVAGDGKNIYLQGVLENSTRGADRKLECAIRDDGATKVLYLPEITKLNSPIGFVATAGVPTIVAIHFLPEKSERIELHILTATMRKGVGVKVGPTDVEKEKLPIDWYFPDNFKIKNLEALRASLASNGEQAKVELQQVRIRDVNDAAAFDADTARRLLKSGGAELIAIHQTTALREREVTVGSYSEFRVATEFEAGHPPQNLGDATPPEKSGAQMLEERLAKPLTQLKRQPWYRTSRGNFDRNPPTMFEIHNLGSSLRLEWSPSTLDGGDLVVSLNHSIRSLFSGKKQLFGPDLQGDKIVIFAEKFKQSGTTTSCSFTSGKWKTLSMHKSSDGSTNVTIACATLIPFKFTPSNP